MSRIWKNRKIRILVSMSLLIQPTLTFGSDVDGQIERCNERIAEGILPDFFQTRLERYEAIRQHKM